MFDVTFAASATAGEILTAVGMGLGTVFAGLICIILICKLMSFIVRRFEKKPAAHAPSPDGVIENRGELCAVIAAAVSEMTGKDIEAIRIVSIKKV